MGLVEGTPAVSGDTPLPRTSPACSDRGCFSTLPLVCSTFTVVLGRAFHTTRTKPDERRLRDGQYVLSAATDPSAPPKDARPSSVSESRPAVSRHHVARDAGLPPIRPAGDAEQEHAFRHGKDRGDAFGRALHSHQPTVSDRVRSRAALPRPRPTPRTAMQIPQSLNQRCDQFHSSSVRSLG